MVQQSSTQYFHHLPPPFFNDDDYCDRACWRHFSCEKLHRHLLHLALKNDENDVSSSSSRQAKQ